MLATESTELDRFTIRFNDGGEASFGAGFYHLYDEEYDKEYVEGGGETFTFGDKLYVAINNYLKATNKGQLVTSK